MKPFIQKLLFFLLLFTGAQSFAQIGTDSLATDSSSTDEPKEYTKEEIKKLGYHPEYVKPIDVIISSRQYFNYYTNLFMLNYEGSDESPIYYGTPTGMNVGGDFAFKFLNFNYQRSIPVGRPSLPDGFRSHVNQLTFGGSGRSFGLGTQYIQYEGMYIMNDKSKIPSDTYANRDNVQFRPITTTISDTETRIKFSKKFSLNVFLDQREQQLKSWGTFTMIMGNKYLAFNADSAFVPPHLRDKFGEAGGVDEVWTNTIHVQPGFGYIYVYKDWNFGLLTYQGAGFQFGNSFIGDENKVGLKYPLIGDFRGVVTYNSKYLYGNASLGMNYITFTVLGARYTWMQTFAAVTVGARLVKRTEEEKAAKKAEKARKKRAKREAKEN